MRVCTNEVENYPTFTERLKAVDIINKMTGEYLKRGIEAGEAKDQLKRLRQTVANDALKAREERKALATNTQTDSNDNDQDDDIEIEYDNAALLPNTETEAFDTGYEVER